ncbi:MAG: hypothetical protein DRG20_02895 [Deltaproteobacteria bacterium]|nr:MAG: hypothetical protein DRG20_02895 [Deltaproteobacteria bacterium]
MSVIVIEEEDREEMEKILSNIEQDFLKLKRKPENEFITERLYRNIHSFKGIASLFNLFKIEQITSKLESILREVKEKRFKINNEILEALLNSVDMIKLLFYSIDLKKEKNKERKRWDVEPIIELLDRVVEEKEKFSLVKDTDKAFAGNGASQEEQIIAEILARFSSAKQYDEIINIKYSKLKEMISLSEQMMMQHKVLEDISSSLKSKAIKTIIENQKKIIQQLIHSLKDSSVQPVSSILTDLSANIWKLARYAGKEVELVIFGGEAELERYILAHIREPIIHIIRNSIDHGIEEPEERIKVGKPTKGIISVVITELPTRVDIAIEDDGRGIDWEKIREKAIENGLVNANVAANLTEKELKKFLFYPGFSTARKVTRISGRGIGLDVVKGKMDQIGGEVDVKTKKGRRTTVVLRIPRNRKII